MTDKPHKTKYVGIEVIKRGALRADDLESGLFMGICVRKDNVGKDIRFVVMLYSINTIRMYNLSDYAIVMYEAANDETTHMTVFTSDDADQEAAVKMLELTTRSMKNEGRLVTNDPEEELINVDTYVDYPSTMLNDSETTTQRSSLRTNAYSTKAAETTTKPADKYNQTDYCYKYTPPKVAEPFNIKRSGPVCTSEELKSMREKVIGLSNGTYTAKPPPTPTYDIENDKKEVDEVVTEMFNENNYHMY